MPQHPILANINAENPAYLLVTNGESACSAFPLDAGESLFAGTGASCQIGLSGHEIESVQCMFWVNERGELCVEDWNSEVKTKLGNKPINAETKLNSGDELEICDNRILAVLDSKLHLRVASELNSQIVLELPSEQTSTHDHDKTELSKNKTATVITESENSNIENQNISTVSCSESDNRAPEQSDLEINKLELPSHKSNSPNFQYDIDATEKESKDTGYQFFDESFDDSFDGFKAHESQSDETEMLKMELEQLRFEVIERDEQIRLLSEQNSNCENESVAAEQTVRLVNRLEDLLVELQSSDDRVRGLEELLRVSDDATQAEQEERQQLESWVTEIENRIIQRESESEAEMSRVLQQLAESKSQRENVETQLNKALASKEESSTDTSAQLLQEFREQVLTLQEQLEVATRNAEKHENQIKQNENEAGAIEKLKIVEQQLLDTQVESSREKAEIARQRAELQQIKDELQGKLNGSKEMAEIDSRVKAMRQHLREIHEEEKLEIAEKKQRSLSGRISQLLNRTNR